jgi:hypothetical protein
MKDGKPLPPDPTYIGLDIPTLKNDLPRRGESSCFSPTGDPEINRNELG